MNVYSQAKVSYAYSLGNLKIRSITNSNVVTTEIKQNRLLAKKVASSNYFKPYDVITYTLIIQNAGNAAINDVVINDDIFHQKYIENSLNYFFLDDSKSDINLTVNENNLIFEIPKLEPYATLIITYKVEIDNIEDLSMDILNIANVQSKEISPFQTNTIDLKQRYALIECEKKCVDYAYYNTDIAYSIILRNKGNVDAIDLEVIDELPKTFELDKKKPITINNTLVDIYSFDNETKILKFIVDKVSAFSEIEVIVKGRIIK